LITYFLEAISQALIEYHNVGAGHLFAGTVYDTLFFWVAAVLYRIETGADFGLSHARRELIEVMNIHFNLTILNMAP
jgi:hypothetical protein